MTHRYKFSVNPQWRRAQLRNIAVKTEVALSKQIRQGINVTLILLALYILCLYSGIRRSADRPAYITAIAIVGAVIGFGFIAHYAFIIKGDIDTSKMLKTSFQELGEKRMPEKWLQFCETLDERYKSKTWYERELFFLILHEPDIIQITHTSEQGTLTIAYDYKTNTHDGRYGHRTFVCPSSDFFSIIDGGKAAIHLIGEVVDNEHAPEHP